MLSMRSDQQIMHVPLPWQPRWPASHGCCRANHRCTKVTCDIYPNEQL